MADFLIETERLRIECLVLDDAAFILELLNDADFVEYIGDKGVRTQADAECYLRDGPLASYAEHGFGLWRVRLKESGVSIGICGLIKRPSLQDVDLGYALLPEYRGKAYAIEAARAVLEFARDHVRLRRVVAIVQPANKRSVRVLERLAFTFERELEPADSVPLALYAWEPDNGPAS
jgi:RimJ/RimL family protein N-acetyltransferase